MFHCYWTWVLGNPNGTRHRRMYGNVNCDGEGYRSSRYKLLQPFKISKHEGLKIMITGLRATQSTPLLLYLRTTSLSYAK